MNEENLDFGLLGFGSEVQLGIAPSQILVSTGHLYANIFFVGSKFLLKMLVFSSIFLSKSIGKVSILSKKI